MASFCSAPTAASSTLPSGAFPFAPVGWLLRHNIDATLAIEGLPERILVLYAAQDSVVPTSESRAFLGELKSDPQIVEFDGPHNIPLEMPRLWRAIEDFIHQA